MTPSSPVSLPALTTAESSGNKDPDRAITDRSGFCWVLFSLDAVHGGVGTGGASVLTFFLPAWGAYRAKVTEMLRSV